MVSAGSDATGCQARAWVTISAFVAPAGQLEDGALMGGAGGGRHDEIAPDDLVAQTVVGEAPDLLGGVSRHQRGHGHKMVTSRAQGQLGMGRAYRSACEVRHRGYAVRVDVPRACARGQCVVCGCVDSPRATCARRSARIRQSSTNPAIVRTSAAASVGIQWIRTSIVAKPYSFASIMIPRAMQSNPATTIRTRGNVLTRPSWKNASKIGRAHV